MLKQTMRLLLLPAAAAVLVACGGGSGVTEAQGLQNPSAFRLSETVSAVPPQ